MQILLKADKLSIIKQHSSYTCVLSVIFQNSQPLIIKNFPVESGLVTSIIRRSYAKVIFASSILIAGLVIFAYLSPIDFLEPEFVRDGILIQDKYLQPNESDSALMILNDLGQRETVSVTHPLSHIPLRIEIKNPDQITVYDGDSSKSLKATFKTEILGKYTVIITNLGSDTAKITVAYGHSLPEVVKKGHNMILHMLWIPLIIMGSYLLVHTNFKILSNGRK